MQGFDSNLVKPRFTGFDEPKRRKQLGRDPCVRQGAGLGEKKVR